MCSVHCAVCIDQHAVCSVHCAVSSVQFAVCSLQCTLYSEELPGAIFSNDTSGDLTLSLTRHGMEEKSKILYNYNILKKKNFYSTKSVSF